MEVHTFLIQIVIILLAARLAGELAAWIRIPSVIGELCAGIIIGPSVFGIIEITQPIYLLAQIGIILLLFEVGIEADIGRLASAGTKALTVAICGAALPFLLAFFLCYYYFHFSLLISLFAGCTLMATSIGITLRVLRDLNKQSTSEAQIILGAAVMDDIIGIVALAMLYEFSVSGEINFWNVGKVILFITLFFLLAPIMAKIMSKIIKRWEAKSKVPGLIPTAIVSLILFFAWIAHVLGAPELLGGFAAGLALSKQFFLPFDADMHQESGFSRRVEEQLRSIVFLFTPIFFVAIGLTLKLKDIEWSSSFIWTLGGALFAIAVVGKFLSGFFLFRDKWTTQCVVGASMIPRGEVGLIFANVGLTVGVLKNDVYTALILVIAATTLLAPFSLKWLFEKSEKLS